MTEWAKGTVARVALHRSGSKYSGSAQPFLSGLKNPVALATHGNAVFVGDWATGKIYTVTAS